MGDGVSRASRTLPRPAQLRPPALLLVILSACLALLPGFDAADAQTAAPSVTGVTVTSAPERDQTYGPGEIIRVTLTFSEAVDVTGTPRLSIDMDPAEWGTKQAAYESGTGTASLVFAHRVVQPNYSTRGIAVLANTLELNGGTVRSASTGEDASLAHAGLDHDPDHKVDWQRTPPNRLRSDVSGDAVAGAPAISSATATATTVQVAWNAPSSDGGETITAYDLRYIRSDASDKSDGNWTGADDVWETGGGALSYRQTGLTPSTEYDFQVRAVNSDGDGAWSATRTATTGTPAISGTATLSYAENAATRVGTFSVTGADEDVDEVTWAISGTDASHFDITHPNGALRLIDSSDGATGLKRPKMPDFESPDDDGGDNSYSITLTATVGGVAPTLAVTVTVTDVDEPGAIALAPVRPKVGTALTATLSDPDTVEDGTTTWAWQRSDGRNNWDTIAGATSASYTPVAADSGQYLRVKVTYTDGHGANKSAEATAHHVVIASVLTGLSATTTSTTLAMTPSFETDVLHYKVSCADAEDAETDTMTVTPTADSGVRLAVNGTQTASGTAVAVTVGKDSDVVIRASGAGGGFTDYVVHCVHDFLANTTVTEEVTDAAMEELVSWGWRDYLVIIDHHGVPRFRRALNAFPGNPRFWLRFSQVGPTGEYRYSYAERPYSESPATQFILDEDFERVTTVKVVAPLTNTGVHDFRVLSNGNYLLMSAEWRVRRDLSSYGYDLSSFPYQNPLENWLAGSLPLMQDSGIQIVSPSRSAVFSWKSWGKLPYEDCTQHWADRYAHVNMTHYFKGTITASFRGCSKVMGISASTGKTLWSIGRTNLEEGEWTRRGFGPEPLTIIGDPEGEFCGQHGSEMHPGNRLTLFDNGEHCVVDPITRESVRTSGIYARAVEYALDVENGEAVFLWDKSQNDSKTLMGTRGGHVLVLDNGDWLISWARERPGETSGNVQYAITQVDPKTGTRKLAFDIPNPSNTAVQANIRASTVPAYALAPQPVALSAAVPVSERTSVFHLGDTDTPQVLVTFNRPVVDFDKTSPSLSVSGGTVAAVSALVADGEPANAYLVTLDPAGEGTVTLRLLANKTCASGGICTADGTMLTKTPPAVGVTAAPLVSFARAAYSVREGRSVNVTVRLSSAHQSAGGVTIPIELDAGAGTATAADDLVTDLAAGQSVTFLRGETSKSIRVEVAQDTLVEADETIVLGFGTLPDDIGTGTTTSTTLTLTNATSAAMTYSRVDGELAEGGSAEFTFAITNGVTFAEGGRINLTLAGSADAGDDYTLHSDGATLSAPYYVTIPTGQSSTSFTIQATDDSVAEPTDETISISARLALTNANLGSRTVRIQPSDVANVPDVTIEAGSAVNEGESASFTLRRTGATTAGLTALVKVTTSGAALSGGAPSSVTFAAGSATASLSLPTRDDTVVRDTGGQVTVYLLGSSSNPPTYLTTPQNQATVTIDDDDVASFTLTASTQELTEGRSVTLTVDTGGVTFPNAQEIELLRGGDATVGDDYTLPGGCVGSSCYLTLQRGARTVRASFSARYDGVDEGDETLVIDAYHDGSFIDSVSITLVDGVAPPPPVSRAGGGGGGFGPGPGEVLLTVSAAVAGEEAPAGQRYGFTFECTPPEGAPGITWAFSLGAGQGAGRFVPGAAPCSLTATDAGGADRVDGLFRNRLLGEEALRLVVTFVYGIMATPVDPEAETVVEEGAVALTIPAGSRDVPYAVLLETGGERCEGGLDLAGKSIVCHTVTVYDADGEEAEESIELLVPATVTITLDAAVVEELGGLEGVQAARERGELRMLHRDDADTPWEELPFTVAETDGAVQIVVSVSSFSDFTLITSEPRLDVLPLHTGWNVVVWDGADGASIADALGDLGDQVDAIYQWVAETQTWRSHRPGGPAILSAFDTFERGATYWIRSSEAVEWTVVEGPLESPATAQIGLHDRWTEIVWRGADGVSIAEALGEDVFSQVEVVYRWLAETQVWTSFRPGAPPILSAFDTFQTGARYWIAVAEAIDWTVPLALP